MSRNGSASRRFSRAALVFVLAMPLGVACHRSPEGARRAPDTAPAEWARQRGMQPGGGSGPAPRDPAQSDEALRRDVVNRHRQRSFMVAAGIVVAIVTVAIVAGGWYFVRQGRDGGPTPD